MKIQIKNNKLSKFNTIRTTQKNIFKVLKEQGWSATDCSFTEIREELLEPKKIVKKVVKRVATID